MTTTEDMPTEDMPTNVVAAIARVKLGIGGIAKMTSEQHRQRTGSKASSESGIQYAYRSTDQIAAAAQPLMGRFGVVCAPTVVSYEVEEVQVNSKPWRHITMLVEWNVYGPGGKDDRLEPARTVGEGRDNSDKGMNKAQTAAYKNLILRLLDIGDPTDDPEHERHETDARRAPDPEPPPPDPALVKLWDRIVAAKDTPLADTLKATAETHKVKLTQANLAHDALLRASIEYAIKAYDAPPISSSPVQPGRTYPTNPDPVYGEQDQGEVQQDGLPYEPVHG